MVENSNSINGVYKKVETVLGIDLRALAVFRILISSLILVDLINRSLSLAAHYTDWGAVPRLLVAEHGEQPWFLSFHMLSGGIELQVFLFVLTGASALCLLVGYKSRLFSFFTWILMLSMHVRNPFINNLGDWLLVDLLFWCMFLPIGALYSVDAQKKPEIQNRPDTVLSIASMAILAQLAFMYFFSVMDKSAAAWRIDGTAVQMALHLDRIASSWGILLLDLPASVLKFLTFATLYLERWGPVLAFFPFFNGKIRTGVALGFMGFHLALALFFELGIFPYICIVAWVLFLPAGIWDFVGEKVVLFRRALTKARVQEVNPPLWESLVAIAGIICMVTSAMMYGGLMNQSFYDGFYKHIEPVVNTLNMKQRWDMFSPAPPKRDGWLIVAAYTEQGQVVNMRYPEEDVLWSRPAHLADTFENQRWRKLLEWVAYRQGPYADHLGQYFERKYTADFLQNGALEDMAVYLMEERLLDDFTNSMVARKRLY